MWGRVLLDPLTQQHPPLYLPNVADMGEPYVSSETQGELHETHWGSGFSHQFLANFDQWEKGNRNWKSLKVNSLPYVLPSSSIGLFCPMFSPHPPSWVVLRPSGSMASLETSHPPWPINQLCSLPKPWPPGQHIASYSFPSCLPCCPVPLILAFLQFCPQIKNTLDIHLKICPCLLDKPI